MDLDFLNSIPNPTSSSSPIKNNNNADGSVINSAPAVDIRDGWNTQSMMPLWPTTLPNRRQPNSYVKTPNTIDGNNQLFSFKSQQQPTEETFSIDTVNQIHKDIEKLLLDDDHVTASHDQDNLENTNDKTFNVWLSKSNPHHNFVPPETVASEEFSANYNEKTFPTNYPMPNLAVSRVNALPYNTDNDMPIFQSFSSCSRDFAINNWIQRPQTPIGPLKLYQHPPAKYHHQQYQVASQQVYQPRSQGHFQQYPYAWNAEGKNKLFVLRKPMENVCHQQQQQQTGVRIDQQQLPPARTAVSIDTKINSFNLSLNELILERLEQMDPYQIMMNLSQCGQNMQAVMASMSAYATTSNLLDLMLNDYLQLCRLELNKLEQELDRLMLIKQRSTNVEDHWANNSTTTIVNPINAGSSTNQWLLAPPSNPPPIIHLPSMVMSSSIQSSQLYFFLWNLFGLHEKLLTVLRWYQPTEQHRQELMIDENSSLSSNPAIAIQIVDVWYQIVEQIKNNLLPNSVNQPARINTQQQNSNNSVEQIDYDLNHYHPGSTTSTTLVIPTATTATTGKDYLLNNITSMTSMILYLKQLWRMSRHLSTLFWILFQLDDEPSFD